MNRQVYKPPFFTAILFLGLGLMRHPEYVVQGATAISAQGSVAAKSTFQQQAEQARLPQQPQPAGGGRGPGFGPPGFPGRPPFGR